MTRNASLNVRTRAEPQPDAGGTTYHVYPFGHTGPKQEPAFTGLLAAYYKNALGGDWSRAAPPRVQPGDTILVHAGEYKDFDRVQLLATRSARSTAPAAARRGTARSI